jgi:hypothetical protein
MRIRPQAALVAALAALPVAAGALDLSGRLGADYWRMDQIAPAGVGAPTWSWFGEAVLHGSPVDPAIVDFSGGLTYGRISNGLGGSPTQNWGGNLNVQVARESILPLGLLASRVWSDLGTDPTSGRTGTTLTTIKGATVGLVTEARPQLLGRYFETDVLNHSIGGIDYRNSMKTGYLGARQNLQSLSYNIDWNVGWSSGDLASANFRSHEVLFGADARLTDSARAVLRGTYYLRSPTVTDPTNPQIDGGGLSTQVLWEVSPRARNQAAYGFQQATLDVPGTEIRQQVSHDVGDSWSYILTETWTLISAAQVSFVSSRVGGDVTKSAGQSASQGASWHDSVRDTGLAVTVTGSGGVLEVSGDVKSAWGANAIVDVTRRIGAATGKLTYGIAYSDNLGGVQVRSITQNLALSSEWHPWSGGALRARVNGSAARQDSATFGVSGNRNLQAEVAAYRDFLSGSAMIGMSDGASGDLRNPAGDGLFVPLPFNARSRYANLSGSVFTPWRLSFNGFARYLWTESPDRPTQHERGYGLNATWGFGEWELRADELYVQGGLAGVPERRANTFLVRLARLFAASF